MRTLIGTHYSGWSEKARWALDHHRIAYTYKEHVPLLGEVSLRLATRRLWRASSVPALIDGQRVIGDSFTIATYADEIGHGAPLISKTEAQGQAEIARYNALSDRGLRAGRVLVLRYLAHDSAARRASIPDFVPAAARSLMAEFVPLTGRLLAAKHDFNGYAADAADRDLRETLASLRAALAGRDYLLDAFSYADVAMAVVLHFVSPPAAAPLHHELRPAFVRAKLAEEFSDVVAWRDRLYARHRAGDAATL